MTSRLTIEQAAKVLRLSRARLRQLEEEGRLVPVERGPRRVRLYDSDVVLAFRARRVEAKLQQTSVTRIVEPTLDERALRTRVLQDLEKIVRRAAKKVSDLDGKMWTAGVKAAQVILEATTPTTTVTQTVTATSSTPAWEAEGDDAAPEMGGPG